VELPAEIKQEAPAFVEADSAATPRNAEYDSMRVRIEETRSRLKAKAFDAMMNGESALLAKEAGAGAGLEQRVDVAMDREVEESIETGLREEAE
jgi:hypothetical protein